MQTDAALVEYYRARAAEYERVYEKPERQADLARLRDVVPAFFAGRDVLDVACGTGYWTRLIAARASSIIAVDLAPETLAIARRLQPAESTVEFRAGDAFDLMAVDGGVDSAFAGFWWSHIRREHLHRFLDGLQRRLPAGSPVLLLDNRYFQGSNWPIHRTDTGGNTYQLRRLENGEEHEVLKNFPTAVDVRRAVAASGGSDPAVTELPHYWYVTYTVGSTR
jgi:SAM-dependent methyltransferase